MTLNWKKYRKQKQQFKGKNYCVNCQQKNSCGLLEEKKEYCCSCYQKEILEELEREGLLANSDWQMLNDYRRGIISCKCLESEKPRVNYINSDGSGWSNCEGKKCKKVIESAGHHRVVKNRNDVRFWGVKSEEKILCLECVGRKFYKRMSGGKRKTWREYVRRGYE